MTVMPQTEILVACCGPSTLGWDPGAAPTPRRCFDLQHKGHARAFGWLNAKALATAGDECVVNIFGVRDSKKIASVPRPSELPQDCSLVTSMAVLSRDSVVCGHEDGAVVSYRLMTQGPAPRVLHKESGHSIADVVSTPSGRVAAASTSGAVISFAAPTEGAKTRPEHLSCRDEQPRCSLAASTVDEQVACGSVAGTVATWDLSTGFAKYHCHAAESAVRVAYQPHSSNVLLTASSSQKLQVWDLRTGQSAQTVALPKAAASVAAGLSPSAVAVGDVAGVVWLYDLRHAAAHHARLPCDHPHPVTQVAWTSFRPAGSSKAHTPAKVSARSMVGSAPTAKQAGTPPIPPRPAAAAKPPQPLTPKGSSSAAAAAQSQAAACVQQHGTGAAQVQPAKPEGTTPPQQPALAPPLSPLTSVSPPAMNNSSVSIPSFDLSRAAPQHVESPVGQPAQRPVAPARSDAPQSVRLCSEQMQELKRHIHDEVVAATAQQQEQRSPPPQQAPAPATPALHMQQLKSHIDAAVASAVADIKADTKSAFQEHEWTQVKQFGLVDDAVSDSQQQVLRQLNELMAEMRQMRQQMEEDAALRERLRSC